MNVDQRLEVIERELKFLRSNFVTVNSNLDIINKNILTILKSLSVMDQKLVHPKGK